MWSVTFTKACPVISLRDSLFRLHKNLFVIQIDEKIDYLEVQAKLFQPLKIFKHHEKCRIVLSFLTRVEDTSEMHNLDFAAPKLLILITDVTDEQFNTNPQYLVQRLAYRKWLNKYLRNEF